MNWSDKPKWWGVPALTRANVNRLSKLLVWLFGLSILFAIVVTTFRSDAEDPRVAEIVTTSAIYFLRLISVVAWLCSVFFFFRVFGNGFRLRQRLKYGLCGKSFEGVWNPFYGLREKDYREHDSPVRRLLVEGYAGFFFSVAVMIGAHFTIELLRNA